jgi:hypothetical protein
MSGSKQITSEKPVLPTLNKKAIPEQLVQYQSVLKCTQKGLRCFCCAATARVRPERNAE